MHSNRLPLTYLCTYRLGHLSTIITEAAFCSRWQLIQRPALANTQRLRV